MDLTGLIDSRNLKLWNKLKEQRKIEIIKEHRCDYLVYSIYDTSTIYVPVDNLNSSSFTHELLHVLIKTKEIYLGGALKNILSGSKALENILSDDLVDHICNCLEHTCMFPLFVKMGYDESEFLLDFNDDKLTQVDVNLIKNNFSHRKFLKRTYNSVGIDFYIGKYFASRACPNASFNYDKQLNELLKIDAELYHILEMFWKEWEQIDYQIENLSSWDYRSALTNFIESLSSWTIGKTIK